MAASGRSAPLVRYGLAVAAVLLALLLTVLLQPLLDRGISLLLFGAVIVIVWYGSVGPALLTIGLSAVACQYFLIHPAGVVVIEPSEDLVRLLVFVLVSLLICTVVAFRKRSEQALWASEAQVRCRVEGKPNIIGVIHSDFYGHISDANDAFLEMVGYTRNELLAGEVRWDRLTPP
jgi:K+-sensing histidine kinase KdpD